MNAKVTVEKPEGGDFILVDFQDIILENVGTEPSSDFEIVKYFRGSQIAVIDRGNVQTVWAFTVVKEWPKLADALAWHDDIRDRCPRVGTVSKQERDYSGATVNRWLKNAGVSLRSLPRIGPVTFTQVSIIGGAVLKDRP